MADFPLTVTNAGRTALAAAIAAGTNLVIDRQKSGQAQYTPDGDETDIMTPFNPVREQVNPAGSSSGTTLQFVFQDESSDVYDIGEIGWFSGNVLFGISSRPAADGWLLQKGGLPLVVPTVYDLGDVPTGNITFNVTNQFPIATEQTPGLVQRASNTQALDSANNAVFMTPMRTDEYFRSKEASQNEYDTNTAGKWIASNLSILATKLKGTIAAARFPRASQTDYNAGTRDDLLVTANLDVPVGKLTGSIPAALMPNFGVGNGRFRVTSSHQSISGSKLNPHIANVVDVDSDGKVQLGAGTNLPVLVIDFIPTSGGDSRYVYSSGSFNRLKLHPYGNADTYVSGDKIYLRDDFTGFSNSASDGKAIGIVVNGNSTTGIYDVVIDLWSSFLGDEGDEGIGINDISIDVGNSVLLSSGSFSSASNVPALESNLGNFRNINVLRRSIMILYATGAGYFPLGHIAGAGIYFICDVDGIEKVRISVNTGIGSRLPLVSNFLNSEIMILEPGQLYVLQGRFYRNNNGSLTGIGRISGSIRYRIIVLEDM